MVQAVSLRPVSAMSVLKSSNGVVGGNVGAGLGTADGGMGVVVGIDVIEIAVGDGSAGTKGTVGADTTAAENVGWKDGGNEGGNVGWKEGVAVVGDCVTIIGSSNRVAVGDDVTGPKVGAVVSGRNVGGKVGDAVVGDDVMTVGART